ncbi:MAG: hypothetical protein L0Y70_25585, partial [Gemmataceae bacterium]|nr:hypothetical protein [Gemmataceae bacterium]
MRRSAAMPSLVLEVDASHFTLAAFWNHGKKRHGHLSPPCFLGVIHAAAAAPGMMRIWMTWISEACLMALEVAVG